MDPVQLAELFKNWFGIALTVFTALVTGSSFLLRMIASFIKSVQESIPDYKPSKALIFFMALLAAISQNSVTAHNIISDSRPK
jgi:hypothetical protein